MKNRNILTIRTIFLLAFVQNILVAQTVNLTAFQPSSLPAGTTIEWHADDFPSSSTINPIAAAPGTYYAFYNFGGTPACYSQPSQIKVVTNTCPSTTINLTTLVNASSVPVGSVVTYHSAAINGQVNTTTQMANAQATAATTSAQGTTYYVSFYEPLLMCYSLPVPIIAITKACLDSDKDGISNDTDLDDDNDGILDTVEAAASCTTLTGATSVNADCDGDGVLNALDLDSDNDGINDVDEARGTDANHDGIADGITSAQGIPASAGAGLTPPNTDLLGGANPYDIDSNDDGISDLAQAGLIPSLDPDNDGIVNCTLSCDTDNDGILAPVDGSTSSFGDAAAHDYTPTIDINSLSFDKVGDQRDFVVNVYEINNVASTSTTPIQFRISNLLSFDITYLTTSGMSDVAGGTSNSNNDWTFSLSSGYITVTAKPGITIPSGGSKTIGFTVKRKNSVAKNTSANLTVTVLYGGTGEQKVDNNTTITKITAN